MEGEGKGNEGAYLRGREVKGGEKGEVGSPRLFWFSPGSGGARTVTGSLMSLHPSP